MYALLVIRKPTRKTSLFKFMTVLKPEVWLSIVAALTITAFMIWLLDKYSPYSAQNNRLKYEHFRSVRKRKTLILYYICLLTCNRFPKTKKPLRATNLQQEFHIGRKLLVRPDFFHAAGRRRNAESHQRPRAGGRLLGFRRAHVGHVHRQLGGLSDGRTYASKVHNNIVLMV